MCGLLQGDGHGEDEQAARSKRTRYAYVSRTDISTGKTHPGKTHLLYNFLVTVPVSGVEPRWPDYYQHQLRCKRRLVGAWQSVLPLASVAELRIHGAHTQVPHVQRSTFTDGGMYLIQHVVHMIGSWQMVGFIENGGLLGT